MECEWLENTTRLFTFIPDTGSYPCGMALPRSVWVLLNSLASGCFWGFSEKKTRKRAWLCARILPVRYALLVKVSKDAGSLLVCTRKKFFCLELQFFCEWRHKWRIFRPPWPTLPGPGRQPLRGSISLKFLLETRLHFKSFDTLDDLLGFWVQKLWCKLVKIFD